MAECGIDIASEHPKLWTDEIIRAADVVITIGCRDTIPTPPDCPTMDRAIDDPDGKDVAAVRPIRDEIEDHVRRLIDEMGLPCRS
jgi:arsenate reductase